MAVTVLYEVKKILIIISMILKLSHNNIKKKIKSMLIFSKKKQYEKEENEQYLNFTITRKKSGRAFDFHDKTSAYTYINFENIQRVEK